MVVFETNRIALRVCNRSSCSILIISRRGPVAHSIRSGGLPTMAVIFKCSGQSKRTGYADHGTMTIVREAIRVAVLVRIGCRQVKIRSVGILLGMSKRVSHRKHVPAVIIGIACGMIVGIGA